MIKKEKEKTKKSLFGIRMAKDCSKQKQKKDRTPISEDRQKKRNNIRVFGAMCIIAIWFTIAVLAWVLPSKEVSDAERRKLAQFPDLTTESVFSGNFSEDFEIYALDQFPRRDVFRTVKAFFHYVVLRQSDNNGIYVLGSSASKMDYPLNEDSVHNAFDKFFYIYENYIMDTKSEYKTYFSLIPDKNYYMADGVNRLSMDYDYLVEGVSTVSIYDYIGIMDKLDYRSYYKTDSHWRQEELLGVAQELCESMGADIPEKEEFKLTKIDKPFYGVYYGQAALPLSPDEMYVLESEYTESATVLDYETNDIYSVYNFDALNNKDMYDIYLNGARALLKIDNPNATSDKELVVFRDSFGSSVIPLMLKGYKTITVVDIRYISSSLLGEYLEFNGQDVLFLYSTTLLNNSYTFKN